MITAMITAAQMPLTRAGPRSAVVCESWAIADIDRTLHSVGGYKSTVGRRQYQEEDHTGDQIMIGVGILVERDTERNCDTGNRRLIIMAQNILHLAETKDND